jgi:hypothetical protein
MADASAHRIRLSWSLRQFLPRLKDRKRATRRIRDAPDVA